MQRLEPIKYKFLCDVLKACSDNGPRATQLFEKFKALPPYRDATEDDIDECDAVLGGS